MDFEKQSIEILKMMCSNSGCWILDSGGISEKKEEQNNG